MALIAGGLQQAGAGLLVNLDATALPLGSLPVWNNLVDANPADDFTRSAGGTAAVAQIAGPVAVRAVVLTGSADFYVGPEAPLSVTGSGSRTIETWVRNPTVSTTEILMSWGRREGADGTNLEFMYGSSTSWGAVGHWGSGFDFPWRRVPAADEWHYLVYTYDGDTARVYADGEQDNYRILTLATLFRDPPAALLKFVVGGDNSSAGNPIGSNSGLQLAKIRVHDTALTPKQIQDGYNAEAAQFGRTPISIVTGIGSVDPAFDPNAPEEVDAFALHPNGQILIGGTFHSVGGQTRERFAKLNADGTLDPSPNLFANDAVMSAGLQSDGRVILTGIFATLGGGSRQRVARLTPSGAIDGAFVAAANSEVRCHVIQPDGRILLGGAFTTMNNITRNYLARVNPDGTLDALFNPNLNALVRTMLRQPDGKIVVGGSFSTVGGVTRNRLFRLNADNTLDTSFNPNVTGSAVYSMTLQPDGKIVIGGVFTAVGGVARTNIARINANGTLDTAFNPGANDIVRSLVMQTDGGIVVAGNFSSLGGAVRNSLARLLPGGTLDTTFNPNANGFAFGVAIQPDGKVLAGGEFTMVGGVPRNAIARLENGPATQTLSVSSSSRIQWLRGGTSPETHEVSFDMKPEGSTTWSAIGTGTRITGGWERTGLSLPVRGHIRARARIIGGYGSGSSGLIETVLPYSLASALENWRMLNFGISSSTGSAADNADPDNDGLENLVEFAFALNPQTPDSATLPEWTKSGNDYTLAFTRPASAVGITYVAESSPSMAPGSWTPLANLGTASAFQYVAPASPARLYLRLRVTLP